MEPPIVKPLELFWEKSWAHVKTIVDIREEPILILDKDLAVIASNAPFYETFQTKASETEGKPIWELGNGEWNIPTLIEQLRGVISDSTFFKGFEVTHTFPFIGEKIMIVNARQIHFEKDAPSPLILFAIDDVTAMVQVAKDLARIRNKNN